ncbi:MAG: hypothetical protein JWN95_2503 [Frankiales bacterium]|nr:hypothetical protein [Frankiales bacterium]
MIAKCSRSMPASTAASALMAGMPTIAAQAPWADDSPSNASSSDTDPVTEIVLPRRKPSGSASLRSDTTGNGGNREPLRTVAERVVIVRSSARNDGCRTLVSGPTSANGSGSATA